MDIDYILTELDIILDTVSIKCPVECASAISRINKLIVQLDLFKNGS